MPFRFPKTGNKLLFNELQTGSEMFSTGVHKVLDVESHHDARVELTKLIKSVNFSTAFSGIYDANRNLENWIEQND